MNRKYCFLVVASILLMLFAACAPKQTKGGSQTVTEKEEPAQNIIMPQESSSESISEANRLTAVASPENKASTPISTGETIITETREITINNVELSYDILPTEKDMFYTHYPADSGKVYIDIAFTVKNLQKQQLSASDVLSIEADYNDGYKYSGFDVIESTSLGFTSFGSIDPLENINMRYLISCPQEVEENTSAPLFLTITVEGVKYQYTIR